VALNTKGPAGMVTLLGLLGASFGCPGTLGDPARFTVATGNDAGFVGDADLPEAGEPSSDGSSCPDVPQEIFLANCTGASCHNSQYKAQGLDLQSPNLAARLVGVPATEGPGLLIDLATPSSSVLYTKVTATPPFGARMPIGAAPLESDEINCVLAWITQEATSGTNSFEGGTLDDASGNAGTEDAGGEDAGEAGEE
jgi:hypothetical protein